MAALYKYIGCVITREGEEMLKLKGKAGTKLNVCNICKEENVLC